MRQAADSGQMTATARLRLVQETGSPWGILVFQPIYRKGAPIDRVEDRRANLEGFALVVFRVGDFVEIAITPAHAPGMNIGISDRAAPPGEQFLYYCSSASGAHGPQVAVREAPPPETDLRHAESFDMAGRQWEIECTATPAWIAAHRMWYSEATLVGGLLLTVLLATYFLISTSRTERIRALASQILAANNDLGREITERKQAEESLRESETKFRTVFDGAADGMFVIDLESRKFVIFNAVCSRMLGFTPEEFRNLSFSDLHLPEDLPLVSEQIGCRMRP